MSAATLVVRAAAALLPKRSRDRYREQWLGELRDADEAGIRAGEIALGSLAFAVTFDRPLPSIPRATPEQAANRSRLAVGLALAAAIVGITRFADFVGVGELTGSPVYDFLVFLASMLLFAFAAVAPVAGVLLVSVTRGIEPRVRVAVWLLALASLAPVVKAALASGPFVWEYIAPFVTPADAAYVVALVIVVAALVLLGRSRTSSPSSPTAGAVVGPAGQAANRATNAVEQPANPATNRAGQASHAAARRLVVPAVAALVLLAVDALCLVDFAAVWAARVPLATDFPVGSYYYDEWFALKQQGEGLVATVFVVWAVAGVVLAVALATAGLLGRSTTATTIARTIAALCVLVIGYAAVVDFLWLMSASVIPTLPTEALFLLGRWGLVAIILTTVGGVRYRSRAALSGGKSLLPEAGNSSLPPLSADRPH